MATARPVLASPTPELATLKPSRVIGDVGGGDAVDGDVAGVAAGIFDGDAGQKFQEIGGVALGDEAELIGGEDVFDIGGEALLVDGEGGGGHFLRGGDDEGVEFHGAVGLRGGGAGGRGGEREIKQGGAAGADGHGGGLHGEAGKKRGDAGGAGRDADEAEIAAGVGEGFEGGALDGEAGALDEFAVGGVEHAALDQAEAGGGRSGGRESGAGGGRGEGDDESVAPRIADAGERGGGEEPGEGVGGGEGALDGGGGDTVDDLGGVDDLGAGLGGELLERLPGGAGGNVEHGAFGGAERGGDAERENEQQGQRGVTEGEHTKYTEVDPRAARNPEENFQGSAGRGRISGRSGARACRPGTRRPQCGRSRARFGRAARGCWRGGRR
jgi:hypothetical protein